MKNFKYLGSIISNEGSKPKILSRIAQAAVALSKLKVIRKDYNIALVSKVIFIRTFFLSSFMPVRAGPLQQNLKKEHKVLR